MKRVEGTRGERRVVIVLSERGPGLHDICDAEFEALYEKYEKKGRQSWTILAQKLWYVFLEAQIETGVHYYGVQGSC